MALPLAHILSQGQPQMPEPATTETTSRSAAERVIRALISIAPACTSREARAILAASPSTPLSALFVRVFQASRLTSKELRHFLSVALRCKALGLRIEKDILSEEGLAALAVLRFPPIDRHSSHAVLCYFSLVDQLFDSFAPDQLLSLFQRLVFVLRQKISTDYQLYVYLRRFLSSHLLDFFLFRRLYSPSTFPFSCDFAIDFRHVLGLRLAKLGYEHSSLRELVFSLLLLDSASRGTTDRRDEDEELDENQHHQQNSLCDKEIERVASSNSALCLAANSDREELLRSLRGVSLTEECPVADRGEFQKSVRYRNGHRSVSDTSIQNSTTDPVHLSRTESPRCLGSLLPYYAFSPLDWLLQSWSLLSNSFYSISEMFYRYDCSLLMEPAALRRFSVVGDVLEAVKADLRGVTAAECSLCSSMCHIASAETTVQATGRTAATSTSVDSDERRDVENTPAGITYSRYGNDNHSCCCSDIGTMSGHNQVEINETDRNKGYGDEHEKEAERDSAHTICGREEMGASQPDRVEDRKKANRAASRDIWYAKKSSESFMSRRIERSIRRAEYLLDMRAALAARIERFNADGPLELSIRFRHKEATRESDEDAQTRARDRAEPHSNIKAETKEKEDGMAQSDMRLVRVSRNISLRRLGSYLCSEKNRDQLLEFARTFTFENIDLLEALRTFLSTFVLTGESQVIERVIGAFAAEYLRQNEPEGGSGASQDLLAAYQRLSYGIVALNTMLHNPALEKRPSAEDFVSRCEAACSDVSVVGRDVLVAYYEEIKAHALQFPVQWADSYDTFLVCASLCAESKRFSGEPNTGHHRCNDDIRDAAEGEKETYREAKSGRVKTNNSEALTGHLPAVVDYNSGPDAIFDGGEQGSDYMSKSGSLSETDKSTSRNDTETCTSGKRDDSTILRNTGSSHQANDRLQTKKDSPSAMLLCDACVIAAYHVLFKQTYRTYGFLNPSTFLAICQLLYHAPLYVEYMRASRCSPAKGLAAYSGFFTTFDGTLFSDQLADEFISLISDAARRGSTSLSDIRLASIRALFGTSGGGQRRSQGPVESIEALRQRIRSNTVPSLVEAVLNVAGMRFASPVLSAANLPLLVDAATRSATLVASNHRSQPSASASSQASVSNALSNNISNSQLHQGNCDGAGDHSVSSSPLCPLPENEPSYVSAQSQLSSDRTDFVPSSSISLSASHCPGSELVIDVVAAIVIANSDTLEDLRFITDNQLAQQVVLCVPGLLARLGVETQLGILGVRSELTREELSIFDRLRRYDRASRDILVRSLAPEQAFMRAVSVIKKEVSGKDSGERRTADNCENWDTRGDRSAGSSSETGLGQANGCMQVHKALLGGRLNEFLAGSIEFIEHYSLDEESHVIKVAGDIPSDCPFKNGFFGPKEEISERKLEDKQDGSAVSTLLLERMAWLWYRSTSASVMSRAVQLTERMPVLFLAFVAAYSFPVIVRRQDQLRALVVKRLQSRATAKGGKEICCGRGDCEAPEDAGLVTTLLCALNNLDDAVRLAKETADKATDILEL